MIPLLPFPPLSCLFFPFLSRSMSGGDVFIPNRLLNVFVGCILFFSYVVLNFTFFLFLAKHCVQLHSVFIMIVSNERSTHVCMKPDSTEPVKIRLGRYGRVQSTSYIICIDCLNEGYNLWTKIQTTPSLMHRSSPPVPNT